MDARFCRASAGRVRRAPLPQCDSPLAVPLQTGIALGVVSGSNGRLPSGLSWRFPKPTAPQYQPWCEQAVGTPTRMLPQVAAATEYSEMGPTVLRRPASG